MRVTYFDKPQQAVISSMVPLFPSEAGPRVPWLPIIRLPVRPVTRFFRVAPFVWEARGIGWPSGPKYLRDNEAPLPEDRKMNWLVMPSPQRGRDRTAVS